jgi:hypothetical protein
MQCEICELEYPFDLVKLVLKEDLTLVLCAPCVCHFALYGLMLHKPDSWERTQKATRKLVDTKALDIQNWLREEMPHGE